jgi:Pectate lyase superfamily protein
VYQFVPNSMTPKTSWADAGGTTPNANPLTLDAAGSALIYGSGSYQLTVTDSLGNAVPAYSGVTSDVVSVVGISAAMQPVVSAATTSAAATLLTYLAPEGGGVARSLTSKLGDITNVRDFGATGNGTTDDTASIQSAINAATGAIYIPTGTYRITSALAVNAGIHIFGDGMEASVLTPASSTVCLTVTTASPVIIEALGISYTTPQASGYGIGITAAGGATNSLSIIRDVLISGAATGVLWTNSAFFLMDHCFIQNFSTYGCQVSNANDIDVGDSNITNCTFFNFTGSGTTGAGINWLSSGGLRVENNKFGALAYGILFTYATDSGSSAPNTAQLIVTGNSFDTMSTAALSMARATATDVFNSVIVANNVMPDCGVGVSIPLDANGAWVSFFIATGNEWIGAGSGSPVGFEIQSTTTFNISNNTLFGNTNATVGISVGSTATGGVIQGNNLSGTFATTIVSTGSSIRVLDNQGVNPIGPSALTPGGSPWTYTAGTSPQTLYLSASSSITAVTQDSVSLLGAATGANTTFTAGLGPNEQITIAYTGSLSAAVMTH